MASSRSRRRRRPAEGRTRPTRRGEARRSRDEAAYEDGHSAFVGLERSALWSAVGELSGFLLLGALLVVFPGQAEQLLVRAAGGILAVSQAVAVVTPRGRERWRVVLAATAVLVGVGLVVDPLGWRDLVAVVGGGGLFVTGVVIAYRGVRTPSSTARLTAAAQSSLFLASGAVVLVLPGPFLALLLCLVTGWVVIQLLVRTGVRLGLTQVPAGEEGRNILVGWIRGKRQAPEDRDDIYRQVFIEGADAAARAGRFALLMFFASVISAVGVLTDSTAVVIGAMLVAPLMTPMMGMSLSLAMGWPNRLTRSALMVLAGMAIALLTGWVLAAILGLGVNLAGNSQVSSRSSPTLVDLVVAVAAGAAGAYALSRKDVSSSLPGVAVAIALVPPLSVVAVSAQAGNWSDARGTLLLFLTNLVAILVVGGGVFVLTGVAPLARVAENQRRVRTATAAVGALAALVIAGLVLNGQAITSDSLANDVSRRTVAAWLGEDSEFTIVSVDTKGNDVTALIVGPGTPPSAQSLAQQLSVDLDHPVRLDLQWIPRERRLISVGG